MEEFVVLLTGYAASPTLFWPVRRYLRKEGYRAESWAYNSLNGSVKTRGAELAEHVRQLDADPSVSRVHLVGHSMGSVIIRCAIAAYRPKKLGRVVLAAPPNRGARLADFALAIGRNNTAAQELSSRADSFVNTLPPFSDVDFGVLAARFDHIVARASTHLDGERDHIELNAPHTVILHPTAGKQIAHFLKHGTFYRRG